MENVKQLKVVPNARMRPKKRQLHSNTTFKFDVKIEDPALAIVTDSTIAEIRLLGSAEIIASRKVSHLEYDFNQQFKNLEPNTMYSIIIKADYDIGEGIVKNSTISNQPLIFKTTDKNNEEFVYSFNEDEAW